MCAKTPNLWFSEQSLEHCIGHKNFTKSLKNHSSHTCRAVGETKCP